MDCYRPGVIEEEEMDLARAIIDAIENHPTWETPSWLMWIYNELKVQEEKT